MIRYILALSVIAATVVAAWLLASSADGGRRAATSGSSRHDAVTDSSIATAEALDRSSRAEALTAVAGRPTPSSSYLLQKEVMIGRTLSHARTMGKDPQFVDIRLVHVGDLEDPSYVGLGEDAENYGPPDKQVWVVRFSGVFRPWNVDAPPRPGTVYDVYDAQTGELLGGGFDPKGSAGSDTPTPAPSR